MSDEVLLDRPLFGIFSQIAEVFNRRWQIGDILNCERAWEGGYPTGRPDGGL